MPRRSPRIQKRRALSALSAREVSAFRRRIYTFYRSQGRSLPWRDTRDPYAIFVSEVMLQQTQIARVLPKYTLFLERFPNWGSLAAASLGDVLKVWQGLGYNRRARALHETARIVVSEFAGALPRHFPSLLALPGVGPYTARAVATFAFDEVHAFVETNIRSVVLHELLPGRQNVTEREVEQLVERTLDRKNARDWFYALMDYGAHLKSTLSGINKRSAVYKRQSAFRGSLREMRGAILRILSASGALSRSSLQARFASDPRFSPAIEALIAEGLVRRRGSTLLLP